MQRHCFLVWILSPQPFQVRMYPLVKPCVPIPVWKWQQLTNYNTTTWTVLILQPLKTNNQTKTTKQKRHTKIIIICEWFSYLTAFLNLHRVKQWSVYYTEQGATKLDGAFFPLIFGIQEKDVRTNIALLFYICTLKWVLNLQKTFAE